LEEFKPRCQLAFPAGRLIKFGTYVGPRRCFFLTQVTSWTFQ